MMTRLVFSPAAVEKVWETALRVLRVVMPEPAAPEPKQAPRAVSRHPAVSLIPLLNVEVAPEERLMFPPEIMSPAAVESPPEVPTLMPPAKVEVAVEEELSPPEATSNPLNSEA